MFSLSDEERRWLRRCVRSGCRLFPVPAARRPHVLIDGESPDQALEILGEPVEIVRGFRDLVRSR